MVIPDVPAFRMIGRERVLPERDGVASYQLVGGVTACQGFDG